MSELLPRRLLRKEWLTTRRFQPRNMPLVKMPAKLSRKSSAKRRRRLQQSSERPLPRKSLDNSSVLVAALPVKKSKSS